MGALVDQLMTVLAADETLEALLPGKIWERPLARNVAPLGSPPTEGSTPDAFDPVRPTWLRPCLVVTDGGEVEHPQRVPGTFASFPRLFFYAPDRPVQRAQLRTAMRRVALLLDHTWLTVAGVPWRVKVWRIPDRFGERPSPEWPGNVYDIDRYQAVGFWKEIA